MVSEDFAHVTLRGAAVRSLAYYVDGLFVGVVAYLAMNDSPLRQRHGDRWGHTVVVRAKAHPAGRRGTARVTIGLAAGLTGWTILTTFVYAWRIMSA